LGRISTPLARTYAKHLLLLPLCVTLSAKAFGTKIGLAKPAFAVQHLSRDDDWAIGRPKGQSELPEKSIVFHVVVAEFGMCVLERVSRRR
jgi:hypothetical protein